MDLTYGPEYDLFRAEVRQFLADTRQHAPVESRPKDPLAMAWQARLIAAG